MEKLLLRTIGQQINLTTTIAPRLPRVLMDNAQLEQILMNLVVNARDAMPNGGVIRIDTANVHFDGAVKTHRGEIPPGDYVMLAVSDTGIGISEAVRARLFQPFFTTKGRGKGTGLGLATVDGIVAAGHGHITVESESGKGAVFRVYLPRIAPSARQVHTATTEPASKNIGAPSSSVLIVEDEEAVRYLSRVILERGGHRVLEAGTPERAEAVFAEIGPVDVLVSDIMLPGGRGTDLFERLRKRYPTLRVVYMSGYLEETAIETSHVDPAVRFIQKPFAAETLLGAVATLVDTAGAGR
jgi:CheY-like chemotaxis protein